VPGSNSDHNGLRRRRFLGLSVAAGCAWLAPNVAEALPVLRGARRISFYNIHTSESLSALYWENGTYLRDSLREIDYLLRDFRTGEVMPIEPMVLDLVHRVHAALDRRQPVHVISGYRSPATNAMLAQRSTKVDKNSYHMYGRAIDIRIPDCGLRTLREAAIQLAGGGVGYYPESDFVHMDNGPVRTW
jgi:uncharacterized protein YcbK (DUF882 family)